MTRIVALGGTVNPGSSTEQALRLSEQKFASVFQQCPDILIIARRVEAAEHEIAHVHDCQYAIINEDFDTALQQLLSIVQASRLRTATQSVRHRQLFQQLGADALLNQG